jgi:transcriptional regulator GlxA family with amidase domain
MNKKEPGKTPLRIHDFSECSIRAFYHDQSELGSHTHDCADVADSVCLSGSRLSHVFKEKVGVTLSDYLLRYRLDKARSSLETSTDSITRIALMVGFHDPAYFSRAFRNYFGITPRQARLSYVKKHI